MVGTEQLKRRLAAVEDTVNRALCKVVNNTDQVIAVTPECTTSDDAEFAAGVDAPGRADHQRGSSSSGPRTASFQPQGGGWPPHIRR